MLQPRRDRLAQYSATEYCERKKSKFKENGFKDVKVQALTDRLTDSETNKLNA